MCQAYSHCGRLLPGLILPTWLEIEPVNCSKLYSSPPLHTYPYTHVYPYPHTHTHFPFLCTTSRKYDAAHVCFSMHSETAITRERVQHSWQSMKYKHELEDLSKVACLQSPLSHPHSHSSYLFSLHHSQGQKVCLLRVFGL